MSKAENKLAEELARLIDSELEIDPPLSKSRLAKIAGILEPHLVGEWMPIADAPKDGTPIIGLMADSGYWAVATVVYLSRKNIWVSPDGGYGYNPLYYLPATALPAPPKGEQSA